MWRDYHNTEYATEDGALYLKISYPLFAFAPPRGFVTGKSGYQRIIDHCAANDLPVRLCSVSKAVLDEVLKMYPASTAESDRKWSDYLYQASDLTTLSGRRYAGQRNHINRFMKEHPAWSFERITPDNVAKVKVFYEKYSNEHIKDYPAYIEGNRKALEALDNMDLYGLFGGALYVAGEIVGVSLGESVGDTLYIHAEKAETSFHGSYPMLMNQFARMFATGEIEYINREEDDGVEGLRTSKMSYHPVELLDKYIVELR